MTLNELKRQLLRSITYSLIPCTFFTFFLVSCLPGLKPSPPKPVSPYTIHVVLAPVDETVDGKKPDDSQVKQSVVAWNFLTALNSSSLRQYRYEFRGICELKGLAETLGSTEPDSGIIVSSDAKEWVKKKDSNSSCQATLGNLASFVNQIGTSVNGGQKVILFFQIPWSSRGKNPEEKKSLEGEIGKIKKLENICKIYFFGANREASDIVDAFKALGTKIVSPRGKSEDQLKDLLKKASSDVPKECT